MTNRKFQLDANVNPEFYGAWAQIAWQNEAMLMDARLKVARSIFNFMAGKPMGKHDVELKKAERLLNSVAVLPRRSSIIPNCYSSHYHRMPRELGILALRVDLDAHICEEGVVSIVSGYCKDIVLTKSYDQNSGVGTRTLRSQQSHYMGWRVTESNNTVWIAEDFEFARISSLILLRRLLLRVTEPIPADQPA